MRSVSDINEQFRLIATRHRLIKSFQTNSVEEMDINKFDVTDFPLLYAQVTGATIEEGVTSFDYEVIVADLVIEEQIPNLDAVYTETFLVMQDVIAMLDNTDARPNDAAAAFLDSRYGLELPVQCQPFAHRFNNLLTGWSTQMSIRVPNALDLCNVPTT